MISNNIIENFDVGVYGRWAAPTVNWNQIKGNNYGVYDCDGQITNCLISNNNNYGLGLCDGEITNCLIRDNVQDGLRNCDGEITNCTIVKNGDNGLYDCNGKVKNCIVTSNGSCGLRACHGIIKYNNIWDNDSGSYDAGTIPGVSDIHNDPFFVDVGHRDCHLKSTAGHWDSELEDWVLDDVNSPCIDAGDPCDPIGVEPNPNGGRINMGAYGGTAEASKSYFGEPVCETIVAGDINGDCKVNFLDFRLIALNWLRDENQ